MGVKGIGIFKIGGGVIVQTVIVELQRTRRIK